MEKKEVKLAKHEGRLVMKEKLAMRRRREASDEKIKKRDEKKTKKLVMKREKTSD